MKDYIESSKIRVQILLKEKEREFFDEMRIYAKRKIKELGKDIEFLEKMTVERIEELNDGS